MKILMIAINDPAGTAILFTKAINRYTEHTCRLITKETRYNHLFEKDLHLPWLKDDQMGEIEQLLRDSDIFHFHMTADEETELGPFKVKEFIAGKTIVHHHHGHPDFRSNPGKYQAKYKQLNRKNLLVSTPDLMKLLPGAKWQPNLVPINEPLYTPNKKKSESPVFITQSPTRRELKNTSDLIEAVGGLKKKSLPPFKFHLIEDTPHKDCLRIKREAHILFDHMQGYFGMSSLEALSQGLCVIAGLDKWNIAQINKFTGASSLPWINASPENLKKLIIRLLQDKDMRENFCALSREFMEKYWGNEKVAKLLGNFYDRLN
jgi:hypothetical protein